MRSRSVAERRGDTSFQALSDVAFRLLGQVMPLKGVATFAAAGKLAGAKYGLSKRGKLGSRDLEDGAQFFTTKKQLVLLYQSGE